MKPLPDGTGVQVFIPRYYRFSHLKNYQDDDFLVLKKILNRNFGKHKKSLNRKPLKELITEARRYKLECQSWGLSKHDSWEATRRHMVWSNLTMNKRFGGQPKRKNVNQERRTLIGFLEQKQDLSTADAQQIAATY